MVPLDVLKMRLALKGEERKAERVPKGSFFEFLKIERLDSRQVLDLYLACSGFKLQAPLPAGFLLAGEN